MSISIHKQELSKLISKGSLPLFMGSLHFLFVYDYSIFDTWMNIDSVKVTSTGEKIVEKIQKHFLTLFCILGDIPYKLVERMTFHDY